MTIPDTWLATFTLTETTSDEVDSICFDLIEAGALGTHLIGTTQIGAFFEGSEAEARAFATLHARVPITGFSLAPVEETNWVQACKDVLQDVQAGPLTIRPIVSASDVPPIHHDKNTIYIIPGLGFGTGHHETTRSVLTLLSHPFIQDLMPRKALDVGTGSGILAIGATVLYNCMVDAFDTDPLAVDNAIENVAINGHQSHVALKTASIDEYHGSYDLLIANIYAEVLVQLENSIRSLLSPGKPLVISGIMSARLPLIEASYLPDSWRLIETIQENGWITRLYERL